jgi:RNA polymerase sigma-70 factor (ECF subfamily)
VEASPAWWRDQDVRSTDPGERSIDFGTLYQQQLPRIYRYLRARSSSDDEAADLTQQVFLNALAALPTYEVRGSPIEAWLFRIARNVAVDASRRNRSIVSFELLPNVDSLADTYDLEATVIHSESLEKIASWISKLDETQRELLLLRFVAGLKTKEIAAIVGKREGAVRKQLQRNLRRLKEYENAK